MSKTINARLQLRNDTAANWTTRHPVLLKGEMGLETDTKRFKFGDGTSDWNALGYAGGSVPVLSTSNPTVSDSGYLVGQMWINTSTNRLYVLVSSSPVTWNGYPTLDDISDLGAGDMLKATYDTNGDGIVNQADKVTSSLTIKFGGGTTEGTNQFTFDGALAKALNFTAGTNISFDTTTPGQITFNVVHPTITTTTDTTNAASPSAGGTFTVIDSVTRDSNGHVTVLNTRTITLPPDNDTIYVHPTTSGNKHIPSGGSAGQILRWSSDGTAVWGVDNDTIYTHPTTSGNKHIPSGGSAGQILRWESDGTAVWGVDNDTVYTHPTTSGNKHIPAGGSAGQILRYSADGTAVWGSDTDTVTQLSTTTTVAEVNITSTAASGNIKLGNAAARIVSTSIPASPTAEQEATLPSLAAVKAYADGLLGANDAMVYKGTIAGGSTGAYGALTPAADSGHTYKVSQAGKINGVSVEVGDMFICITDSTGGATSGNYATVQNNWTVIQTNLDGAVIGPAATVADGEVVAFDGVTGRQVKATGIAYANLLVSTDVFILDGGSSL